MKHRNPARTVADLPAGVVVKLVKTPKNISAMLQRKGEQRIVGVMATKAWWRRGKADPYTVDFAQAPKGWGPLLYDVVMEAAGASGLTSDRKEVSDAARAVWQHYRDKRPDVRSEITTLDHEPDLDPRYSERGFSLSPLARVYYATGTPTIDALRRAGKLVVEGEAAPLAAVANPSPRTFIPPKAVADQARMGLALRESLPPSQRCCTTVGIRRAVQLANRQPVSVSTLKRMRSYFQRHAVDSRGVGWRETSKGWQAHLAWGGDAGRKWCNEILDRLGE